MNLDIESVIAGGTLTGFAGAIGYMGKLILEWRHQNRSEPRADATARVTDASTANAILTTSLHSLQDENARLITRNTGLQAELDARDAKIADLETRIREMATQLAQMGEEVAQLRTSHSTAADSL